MNIYTLKLSLIDNVVKQYTFLMHMSNHASETKGFNDVRLLII